MIEKLDIASELNILYDGDADLDIIKEIRNLKRKITLLEISRPRELGFMKGTVKYMSKDFDKSLTKEF